MPNKRVVNHGPRRVLTDQKLTTLLPQLFFQSIKRVVVHNEFDVDVGAHPHSEKLSKAAEKGLP